MNFKIVDIRAVLLFFFLSICFKTKAQKILSKDILNVLTNKIETLQKTNSSFNAEMLGIYSEYGGGLNEIQKEINNIPSDIKNQKLLFQHWYNFYDAELIIDGVSYNRYTQLFSYFKKQFNFDEATSAYLANYISKLQFLNEKEKTNIYESQNKVLNSRAKELQILDTIFNLKEENVIEYSKLKNRILDNLFNGVFNKEQNKSSSSNPIYLKNNQLNIDVVISVKLIRKNITPSYLVNYGNWKSEPVERKLFTKQGKAFFDLINLIPYDKYPIVRKYGYYIKTFADFDSIEIKASRGYCSMEVKRKDVVFKEDEPLNENVKTLLIDKLKTQKKGIYQVEYSIGNVGDKTINEIIIK